MSLTLPFGDRCHLSRLAPNQPGNPIDAALVWILGLLPASRGIETLARWSRPLDERKGPGQGEAVSRDRSVVFEHPTPDISIFWYTSSIGRSFVCWYTGHLGRWSLLRCDGVSR